MWVIENIYKGNIGCWKIGKEKCNTKLRRSYLLLFLVGKDMS